jgi:PAS domain-containing protein
MVEANPIPMIARRSPPARPSPLTDVNDSHSMTFRFLRPDGRGEVWLEQVAVTHFNASGMPTRINGLTTDVTERNAI